MADAALLKGGVIVVVLLAALAVFDAYSNYSYAGNQATGAAVLRESGGGSGVAGVSIDLSNYPAFFIKNGIFDAVIVVGDQASSAHVLAAADIAYSLVSFGATSSTKLASEVSDTFAQNVISIGTGCANAITNNIQTKFGQISGGGGRCWNGALSGEGIGAITLYDFGNGKAGMVVEGYTDADVRRAAKVLVSYKDWQASGYLVGKAILVEATSQGGTQLHSYGWGIATGQTVCTDSDGGRNPYVKGTTTGDFLFQDEVSSVKTVTDSCNGDTAVFENYCNSDGYRDGSDYDCPKGCTDGVCLPEPAPDCSKGEKTILRGGETKLYYSGASAKTGHEYEITADFVSSMVAVFTVNGETTRNLPELGERVLADGTILRTFTTVVDKQPYGMQFCLQKGEAEQAGLAATNTLALKADSFSVIALGAAFGSYYDANAVSTRSTCKPDNFFLASWVYAPTTNYDEETEEQYESSYQNIMLFDVDADSKLAVKPNGHRADIGKLKFSEKGLATFNWSEAAGAWILNEGPECTLALAYDPEKMWWENVRTVYAHPRLAKGINFVSVVPQMIGKTMEDVKGDCDLTGAYSNFGHTVPSASYALTKGAWDWWTPKHTFAQNELGLAMWLYSDNTCKLDFFS